MKYSIELPTKVSEITAKYRSVKTKASFSSPGEVSKFLRSIYENINWVESAYLLAFNKRNNVIGHYKLSIGGIGGTVVDKKVVLGLALSCQASAIIIAHNHPSGNLKPSQSDISITKDLNSACKIMDIDLLDHIILTDKGHYSFTEQSGIL